MSKTGKTVGYHLKGPLSTSLGLVIALGLSVSCLTPATASESVPSSPQSTQETAPTTASKNPDNASILSPLVNTVDSDRLLLEEISDTFIFDAREAKTRDNKRGKPAQPASGGARESAWHALLASNRLQIPDHERVAYYRAQYEAEARWLNPTLSRANPFIGHIVDELHKQNLPLELALLPAIESGFRPDVHSPKQAVGMWQIVPATAEELGLERNQWFDARSDIRHSTTAAIEYLGYLNSQFHGDWLLTLAAYNAGLGRVKTAVQRNKKAKRKTDFWSLELPTETRNYVPKFLALVATLRYDQPPALEIPRISRGSAFDVIDIGQRVDIEALHTLTGIPEADLRNLNAALLKDVTPPGGPHLVYLPQGVGTALVNSLTKRANRPLVSAADTHVVKPGDTLSSISALYNVKLEQLMAINQLDSSLIKIGQTLAVADAGTRTPTHYIVTIGDTLSQIAERFSISVDDIRDEDGRSLSTDVIHPGERLTILE